MPDEPAIKVLVIEDEPRLRDLLLRAIQQMGFAATGARSAEEAQRLLDAQTHDILLLDLNLPGQSGMDFYREFHQRHPQTPVIILTGFGDLAAAREAIRLDVVDFLTKPCHLGELEVSLDRARRRLKRPSDQPETNWPTAISESGGPPTLDDLERQHILSALERHGGNRAAAAAELGISLRTLYYRLTEYAKQGYRT
jgi:DNA-binding NtrC family response regulator